MKRRKKGIYKKCLRCNKEFYEFPSLKGKKKFCSKNCANKYNAKHLSEIRKGDNNPMYGKFSWNKNKTLEEQLKYKLKCKKIKKERIPWNKGKKLLEEHKLKIGKANKGNKWTLKEKRNASLRISLENHPNWQGGISFEPYTKEFNNTLKRKIRKRDNYTCQKCSKLEKDEYIGKRKSRLSIHHIDYNKKNCNENNLITLCRNCNIKVNYERIYWTNYFNNKINKYD